MLSDMPSIINPRPRHAWTPPPPVARILRNARRRYHALAVTSRPALMPIALAGFFRPAELVALGAEGWWPLSRRALLYLITDPRPVRQRRRKHTRRRVVAVLANDL